MSMSFASRGLIHQSKPFWELQPAVELIPKKNETKYFFFHTLLC